MEMIVAVASSYEEKYFLHDDYRLLPVPVKNILQSSLVLLADTIEGIASIAVVDEGTPSIVVRSEKAENDFEFDEIYAREMVNLYIEDQADFLQQLLTFHTMFYTKAGKAMRDAIIKQLQEETTKKE